MAKFNIELNLNCYYPNVEADCEGDAIEKAMGWFAEAVPNYSIEEVPEIVLTNEIEKVITNCYYIRHNKPHDCAEHCPLCDVCRKYYEG